MSVDAWSQCPMCTKGVKKVEYGEVSEEVYNKYLEEKAAVPADSLREDYNVYSHNGDLCINYYASCENCGFQHTFKHKGSMLTK